MGRRAGDRVGYIGGSAPRSAVSFPTVAPKPCYKHNPTTSPPPHNWGLNPDLRFTTSRRGEGCVVGGGGGGVGGGGGPPPPPRWRKTQDWSACCRERGGPSVKIGSRLSGAPSVGLGWLHAGRRAALAATK